MDLEGAVRPVVEAVGLELVEVALHRGQGRHVLKVIVDREGGVDLDTIAGVSERISRRLDLDRFDPGPYSLEVTSPGIERPLKEPRDFARQVGGRVRVRTEEPVEGATSFVGTVVEAGPLQVLVATERGDVALPYEAIASARTVADWNAELRGRRSS